MVTVQYLQYSSCPNNSEGLERNKEYLTQNSILYMHKPWLLLGTKQLKSHNLPPHCPGGQGI